MKHGVKIRRLPNDVEVRYFAPHQSQYRGWLLPVEVVEELVRWHHEQKAEGARTALGGTSEEWLMVNG